MTKIQLKIIDETIKEKFVEVQKQAAEKIQNVVAAIQGQDEARKIFEQTRYTWVDPYFNIQQMVQQGGAMPTLPPNWEYRPYVDNAQIQTFREEMKERIMSGKPIEGFRPPWEVSPPPGGNYQPGGPQPGGYQPGGPQPGGYQPGSYQPGSGYSGPTAPMPRMEYQGPAGSGYTAPQSAGGYQPGYIDPNLSTAPTYAPTNENTGASNTASPTAPPTSTPGPSYGTAPSSPPPSGGYQQGYIDPNRPR